MTASDGDRAHLAAYAERIAANAPPLTAAQVDLIVAALRPAQPARQRESRPARSRAATQSLSITKELASNSNAGHRHRQVDPLAVAT